MKKLLFVSAIIFLIPLTTYAMPYTYTGLGNITFAGVDHDFYMQMEMDSVLYDAETKEPITGDPSKPLSQVQSFMQNGTMYIEDVGLFTNVTGGFSGFLNGLSTPAYVASFDEYGFGNQDIHFGTFSHSPDFLDTDGSPYTTEDDRNIEEPWNLEHGLCAPLISFNGPLQNFDLFGDRIDNSSINLTLARQDAAPPVPEPTSILLLGAGISVLCLRRKSPKKI